MVINLVTCSKQAGKSHTQIKLSERLPFFIVSDCVLECDYSVQTYPDYFLLTLDVSGTIPTQCQRCLEIFESDYSNYTELAICRDEKTAENLMEDYECIVNNQKDIDLVSVVTDELYLYAPEKHLELIECNGKI